MALVQHSLATRAAIVRSPSDTGALSPPPAGALAERRSDAELILPSLLAEALPTARRAAREDVSKCPVRGSLKRRSEKRMVSPTTTGSL